MSPRERKVLEILLIACVIVFALKLFGLGRLLFRGDDISVVFVIKQGVYAVVLGGVVLWLSRSLRAERA